MTKAAPHRELFANVLKSAQILSDPHDLAYYGKDVSPHFHARPSLVLLPENASEVSAVISLCNQNRIAVVPSGGRTGYSGGATAENGEIILSLAKMNKILEVNLIDQTLRCEAGATTEMVRNRALEHGLFYPVDFTSKGSSQIGGNIATNAGGIRVIRYGNTRDWVLGMKVVTASGELLDLNGSLFKNATGYDLRGLMIGSEGTLGVIVEATLRLTTVPKESTLCLCGAKSPEVALMVLRTLRNKFTVNVFEYFERAGLELVTAHNALPDPFATPHECYFLIEAETPEERDRERFQLELAALLENNTIADVVIAQSQRHSQEIMGLRELIGETANKHYVPHKNDISVPVPSIPDFLSELRKLFHERYSAFRNIIFGHVGDGNLHVNVLKPDLMEKDAFFKECINIDNDCFDLVRRFRGSVSAEHGVGLLKKPFLHLSRAQTEIELMRAIRRVFDPNAILNPGKIV